MDLLLGDLRRRLQEPHLNDVALLYMDDSKLDEFPYQIAHALWQHRHRAEGFDLRAHLKRLLDGLGTAVAGSSNVVS
jgi:hypothetical protein